MKFGPSFLYFVSIMPKLKMKRLQLSLFNQFCEEKLSKSLPGSKIKSSGFVSFINNCFEVLKTQPVCY